MEQLTLINGNGQAYKQNLPRISFLTSGYNDVALDHIFENTGLRLKKTISGYEVQPTNSAQIAALFLTYNYKTQYHDNASNHNTLFLKSDHHIGFKVDSVCYDCCKENKINTDGLRKKDRLSC